MASTDVPFPPTGHFVDAVRSSARAAREAAGIKIHPDSIRRLLLAPALTTTLQRLSANHGFAFPFAFPSALSELNFLSVLSLLNFASGYRAPLHRLTGRGAYDNIRALLFGLYLSGTGPEDDMLSARAMASIGAQTVAELMHIKVHEERAHPTLPGVTVGELGGPGHEIVQLVTGALNSAGKVLVEGGYPNMGAFVVEALREGEKARTTGGTEAELNVVVERLVRAFPGLRDMAIVNGQPVYCFKKAMILIHGIYMRFSTRSPAPFPIPDTSSLPIFSDNVIPSMLVHLGVLDLSGTALSQHFPPAGDESLSSLLAEAPQPAAPVAPEAEKPKEPKAIPDEGPVLAVPEAFALRAAAIDACELIVEMARAPEFEVPEGLEGLRKLTLPDIDGWLWAVAKDRPDYRKLKRFVLTNTVFF